jgi:hypothetical protein
MRKQDRIAREQQNRSEPESPPKAQPPSREHEQAKGSASTNQPNKPREPGKLPLPD